MDKSVRGRVDFQSRVSIMSQKPCHFSLRCLVGGDDEVTADLKVLSSVLCNMLNFTLTTF